MTRKLYLCCILLISSLVLVSQQDILLQADSAFSSGDYESAIQYYSEYSNINNDSKALGNRGISYFNYNLIEKAIEDFTSAKKLGNDDPLLYLKMGQSKQFLRAFDEAAFFYKKYIELAGKKSTYKVLAELELKNCVFSALQSFETSGTLIQSFDETVNSPYDEISPIQSPSLGNVFYFSSNRNKSDFDVFSFTLSDDGLWSKNDFTQKPFNNSYDNYALDVDVAKGNALLYKEVVDNHSVIQFATYNESGQDIVIQLPPDIFESAEDISIVNHNLLVFASDKLDGYGGFDLYTILYKNGTWGKPNNLGSAINSPFDDRCPFYSHNLEHLYFSSNRPYCFGGYDLYYCDVKNKIPPVNMGYGLNSAGDDLHFNIDDAGHMVTFSSNRKTGLGGFDLYFGYLQDLKNIGIKDSITFEYLSKPDEDLVFEKKSEPVIITTVPDTVLAALLEIKKEAIIVIDSLDNDVVKEIENPEEVPIETTTTAGPSPIESNDTKDAVPLKKDDLETIEVDVIEKDTIVQDAIENIIDNPVDSFLVNVENKPSLPIDSLANDVVELPAENTPSQPSRTSPPLDTLENAKENVVIIPTSSKSFTKPKNWVDFDNPQTLLYEDRQDLIRGKNMVKLNQLIIENNDNKLDIVIMAHTDLDELGLPEYVQYNTLKRALAVAKYLVENGIDKNRVSIESVANNYPLVKSEIAGKRDLSFYRLNKRIDIQIYDKNKLIKEDALYKSQDIPIHAFDKKYELFRSIREGTYYSVEIASADRIFKNAILRLYNDIYIRRDKFDGQNKYYIGIYTQREDAVKLQKQLQETSAPYAKIVKFENGRLTN